MPRRLRFEVSLDIVVVFLLEYIYDYCVRFVLYVIILRIGSVILSVDYNVSSAS